MEISTTNLMLLAMAITIVLGIYAVHKSTP
jgi:hypothetical protein